MNLNVILSKKEPEDKTVLWIDVSKTPISAKIIYNGSWTVITHDLEGNPQFKALMDKVSELRERVDNLERFKEKVEYKIKELIEADEALNRKFLDYVTLEYGNSHYGTLEEQKSLRHDVEDLYGETAALESDKLDKTEAANTYTTKAEFEAKNIVTDSKIDNLQNELNDTKADIESNYVKSNTFNIYKEEEEGIHQAIQESIQSTKEELTGAIDKKQDKLKAGYGINIKEDNTIESSLDLSLYRVVDKLPLPEDAEENKIYFIKNTVNGQSDIYVEYIVVNGKWEKLGEYKIKIDLSGYLTTEEVLQTFAKVDGSNAKGLWNITAAQASKTVGKLIFKGYTEGEFNGYNDKVINIPYSLSQLHNDMNFVTRGEGIANPYPLVFIGNTNESYDGSKVVTVYIPSIPDTLPNPEILTWTGYSYGNYDGKERKNIEIPSDTSQLTNNAGFITSDADITGNAGTADALRRNKDNTEKYSLNSSDNGITYGSIPYVASDGSIRLGNSIQLFANDGNSVFNVKLNSISDNEVTLEFPKTSGTLALIESIPDSYTKKETEEKFVQQKLKYPGKITLEYLHTGERNTNIDFNIWEYPESSASNNIKGTFLTTRNTYLTDDKDGIYLNGEYAFFLTESDANSKYVTLNTRQTISATKTFSTQQAFTQASGTSPFTVTSDTVVTNLNADLLDGKHDGELMAKYFVPAAGIEDYNAIPVYNGIFTIGVQNPLNGPGPGYGKILQLSNQTLPVAGTDQHWVSQIAMPTNSRIYYRERVNIADWGPWHNIAYIDDVYTKTETDSKYVTLDTEQSINGKKTFNNIVTINPTNTSGKQDGLILYDNGGGTAEGLRIRFTSESYQDGIYIEGCPDVKQFRMDASLYTEDYTIAKGFKTPSGTSSQFLKADGSVDSSTYLTSHQSLANYLTPTAITSNTWGNTIGVGRGVWASPSGGGLFFRDDNPVAGQLSMGVDGVFYQDEGRYKVLDENTGATKRWVNQQGFATLSGIYNLSAVKGTASLSGITIGYRPQDSTNYIPYIGSDSVLGIGRYLDFNISNRVNDRSCRITLDSSYTTNSAETIYLPHKSGTFALLSDITILSSNYYKKTESDSRYVKQSEADFFSGWWSQGDEYVDFGVNVNNDWCGFYVNTDGTFIGFTEHDTVYVEAYTIKLNKQPTISSDIRLKENISEISQDDERLLKAASIKAKDFKYIKYDKPVIGYIAQDVQEVLPNLVNADKEGYLSLNYEELLILKIAALESENAKLKERINSLEERLNKLEEIINNII